MIELYNADGVEDNTDVQAVKATKAVEQLNTEGLTVDSCPYPMGSKQAKTWFNDVLKPTLQSNITPEMKAKHGDQVTGAYAGKPLVPGVKGSEADPQADFDLMSDRIRLENGVDQIAADKIAAKLVYAKYGVPTA